MRLDDLTIALRPRSPWEATDLGIALVRRHARAIWAPWVLVTLPAILLFSGLAYWVGPLWIGFVLFWWLKPLFDCIPLFVLSRAVFGATPTTEETLHASWRWALGGVWPWLLWRRLHPGRALLLPVDLLEGLTGSRRADRCRVLSRGTGSPSILLTVICINVEQMLSLSILLLGFMFVPIEFLSDSAKAIWETLFENPPLWAQFLGNIVGWLAISIVEPCYIGAGFGLYLNRRTQLEAWDLELAFRRIAARLSQMAAVLVFGLGLAFAFSAPVRAEDRPAAETAEVQPAAVEEESNSDSKDDSTSESADDSDDAKPVHDVAIDNGVAREPGSAAKPDAPLSLQTIFSRQYRADDAAFNAAVDTAYRDPDLNPKATVTTWQRRNPAPDASNSSMPAWAKNLGAILAFLSKFGLWILVGLLLALLLRYHQVWLPWISDRFEPRRPPDRLAVRDLAQPEHLPDDLVAAVRALWRQQQPRAALALLYRAAVQRLSDALSTPLPPGATESECLRQARRLQDKDYAGLFGRIVRCWQGAAYADRLPAFEEVESLLGEWRPLRSEPA